MLKIIYGNCPGAIFNTSLYFNNSYLDSWITESDFARKVIKRIDRADILSAQAIDSKALGIIPVTQLSGGVKTLLLILNEPEKIFNASTCGNNCAKYILEIAKLLDRDVTINLHHIMDFGDGKFTICIENTGTVVHSMKELLPPSLDCIRQEAHVEGKL